MDMKKRFRTICMKWLVIGGIFAGFMVSKLYVIPIILIKLFAQEFQKFLTWMGEGTELGAKMYWSMYWQYWAAAYMALFLMFFVWYLSHYRRKRPHLKVGGVKTGRSIWIKGVRRGLVYDVWDFKNYVWVVLLKKKDLAPIHQYNQDVRNGGMEGTLKWPDPLAIPFGKWVSSGRIIYMSYPWSLRIHRWIIPDWVNLQNRVLTIEMPDHYFINQIVKDKPGRPDLVITAKRPGYEKHDALAPAKKLVNHYKNARLLVKDAAASNHQVHVEDLSAGSIPVIGKTEGKFTDD